MNLPTVAQLRAAERTEFSQNGEDGVLMALLDAMPGIPRVAAEFGVGDGTECCTRILRDNCGWEAHWFDAKHGNDGIRKVKLTAENINAEFDAAGVPHELGVLAIDVDGMDYWLWRALNRRAHIVICEINAHIPLSAGAITVPYDPAFAWEPGSDYFGCSLRGATRLARARGLTLACCESTGTNAFFVRNGAFAEELQRVPQKPVRMPADGTRPWVLIGLDGEPAGKTDWQSKEAVA